MEEDEIFSLISSRIYEKEKMWLLFTMGVGRSMICPDIIVDCVSKTVEINWSEIDVSRLSKEQYLVLECLLDTEDYLKKIFFHS